MSRAVADHRESTLTDLQARAGTYLLVARLFREAPTPELLRQLVERRWLTAAEQWAAPERSLDPVEDPVWPAQAEAIAVEFTRLFAVPGEQAVHPYESVYCDTLAIDTSTACSPYFEPEAQSMGLSGFLHGSSAVAVRAAYRRAGFEVDAAVHELPDHLAIELEFMGQLLARGGVEQAETFFAEHLGRWVFRCLADVRQEALSGFYRTVADALAVFLRREHQVHASRCPNFRIYDSDHGVVDPGIARVGIDNQNGAPSPDP
jgi:TorA maturation chaperone TorD